jgi:transcriptional regulator with XRE-family HTH domain
LQKTLRSPGHKKLTELLTDLRREADLTQRELADRLEESQSFVSRVETGERVLDTIEAVRWARECGLAVRPFYNRLATALEKVEL